MPKKVKLKLMKRHFFTIFLLFFTFHFLLPGIAVFALESDQGAVSVNFTCEKFKYPWCNSVETGVSGLIGRFYQIALALVGVTAFGVIVFAGITYTLSAGNSSKQKDSIDWITSASLGIVLLLGAYLLLWTINPNLINLTDPKIEAVKITPLAISTSTSDFINQSAASRYHYEKNPELTLKDTFKNNWNPEEKAALYSHAEALTKLAENNISAVGTNGLCADQNKSKCTSFNGIPKNTINTLAQIKNDLKNSSDPQKKELANLITVTGGTESGHQAQGFGYPSVDVRYNNNQQYKQLYQYLKSNESKYGITVVSECNSGCDEYYSHITASHMSIYTKK